MVSGRSGSSATAKWVQIPSRRSSGRAVTAATRSGASSGAQPTRCIPVSTLRWTGSGSAARSATALASASMPGSVYTTGVSPASTTTGAEPAGGSDSTRIGASSPAARQGRALLDERDAQPGRARLEGGAGHRDRPVPVAVRLHDGEERRRIGERGQPARVARTAPRSTSPQVGRTSGTASVTCPRLPVARGRRVTIPTRRPSASTTGMWVTSRSCICAANVSERVVGPRRLVLGDHELLDRRGDHPAQLALEVLLRAGQLDADTEKVEPGGRAGGWTRRR